MCRDRRGLRISVRHDCPLIGRKRVQRKRSEWSGERVHGEGGGHRNLLCGTCTCMIAQYYGN